jgi:hypothetical protein
MSALGERGIFALDKPVISQWVMVCLYFPDPVRGVGLETFTPRLGYRSSMTEMD